MLFIQKVLTHPTLSDICMSRFVITAFIHAIKDFCSDLRTEGSKFQEYSIWILRRQRGSFAFLVHQLLSLSTSRPTNEIQDLVKQADGDKATVEAYLATLCGISTPHGDGNSRWRSSPKKG